MENKMNDSNKAGTFYLMPKLVMAFMLVALTTLLVGVLGVYYTNRMGDKGEIVGSELAPLGDAAMEIKLKATRAHLIFEEILAGDVSEDINEVWSLLDESMWYCDAIMKGGEKETILVKPTTDKKIIEKTKGVKKTLQSFKQSAQNRYSRRQKSVATGSRSDQEYDAIYEIVQDELTHIIDQYRVLGEKNIIYHAGQIKYLIANAHLFLEEHLSGDTSIDYEDIEKNLADGRKNIDAIGATIGAETIKNLIAAFDAFVKETRHRHETTKLNVRAGGKYDEDFDNIYESFVTEVNIVEKMINDKIRDGVTSLSTANQNANSWMIVFTILGFVFAIVLGWFFAKALTNALTKVVDFAKKISEGDLTAQVEIESRDEIGEMADALNIAVQNFKAIVFDLASTTQQLSGASGGLSSVSSELDTSSQDLRSQTESVAAASEEISASVDTVATAAQQASASISEVARMTEEMTYTFTDVAKSGKKTADNTKTMAESSKDMTAQIDNVASAIEEMTASLNEVAKNSAQANRVSQKADQRTKEINTRMEALVASSKQIGKVINVIKDIADQTNMLALNATIEAAGAGDAGKGFAVVAGEVKELAKQSADATDVISVQIEEIQSATDEAVHAIEDINNIISEIASINEMIAASVEEQTATASEISKSVAAAARTVKTVSDNANESAGLVETIARSIEETSKTATIITDNMEELQNGIRDVARSINEASKGVNDITSNIQQISAVTHRTAKGASETRSSSEKLSEIAAALKGLISRFKL